MAKPPRLPGPQNPEEFPQVEPTELHPTNNIRFVMWEVAKLAERVDNLVGTVDKLSVTLERNAEKQAAALKESLVGHASDIKDRLTEFREPVAEIKGDLKDAKDGLVELGNKVAFVKGALWVFGGLFAIAIVILGVIARKVIGG